MDDASIEHTGVTALMRAASSGHAKAVRKLLKAGVPRDARDMDGDTAFDYAQAHGNFTIAKLIRDYVPATRTPAASRASLAPTSQAHAPSTSTIASSASAATLQSWGPPAGGASEGEVTGTAAGGARTSIHHRLCVPHPPRAFYLSAEESELLEALRQSASLPALGRVSSLMNVAHPDDPATIRARAAKSFRALYPAAHEPPLTSQTSVPPWTRGGFMRDFGAPNLGKVERRPLYGGMPPTAEQAARRRVKTQGRVAQWRHSQRFEGEQWLEDTRWYGQGEPTPAAYLKRTSTSTSLHASLGADDPA